MVTESGDASANGPGALANSGLMFNVIQTLPPLTWPSAAGR